MGSTGGSLGLGTGVSVILSSISKAPDPAEVLFFAPALLFLFFLADLDSKEMKHGNCATR